MNGRLKKYAGRGLGGSQAQGLTAGGVGGGSPSLCGHVHQPGSSLNPIQLGFYRASPWRHEQLFPAPLPSPEDGVSWEFQAAKHGLTGDQPSPGAPPESHQKNKRWSSCPHHLENHKHSARNWGQRPIHIFFCGNLLYWPRKTHSL